MRKKGVLQDRIFALRSHCSTLKRRNYAVQAAQAAQATQAAQASQAALAPEAAEPSEPNKTFKLRINTAPQHCIFGRLKKTAKIMI